MNPTRRFHRYLSCRTCGVEAGQPCWRMPVRQATPAYARATNTTPHPGRIFTRERCGLDRVGLVVSNCNLPPNHGGEWHVNKYDQRWRAS